MEADLMSSPWILNKVSNSRVYAQNLYAAMCNNNFQKNDVWPTLKGEIWGCSWRAAGGIVADMRGQGDYLDYYCSGIGNYDSGFGLDNIVPELDENQRRYVPEGVVTEEIESDLNMLGWVILPEEKS